MMIDILAIKKHLNESNIEYEYFGDSLINIDIYSLPDNIKNNSIIWFKDPKKIKEYNPSEYKNLLIVTSPNYDLSDIKGNFLVSWNSKELFFSILNKFFVDEKKKSYIESSSVVETCEIGKNVYIGHNCYISPNTVIKDNVIIKNNVVIEGDVFIGNDTIIYSGAVIGSDGYGYYKNEKGKNVKVPHLGGVIIGSNVEIGANTCIDKGTLGNTIIEDNVKIDNLCHIAHNVHIEKNVNVIALSMIAGSVLLKENSYIAPSSSVKNQLTIGSNSIVGLGSVVVKDVEPSVVVAGVPAKVIRKLGDK